MSETTIHAVPVLTLSPPLTDKWARERQAFRRLLPTLLEGHRGKYVAIHDEKMVASADELIPLALDVYQKHGYIPIFIDRVTDQPAQPARIPHFRILRDDKPS
jgi:hypothetical protein